MIDTKLIKLLVDISQDLQHLFNCIVKHLIYKYINQHSKNHKPILSNTYVYSIIRDSIGWNSDIVSSFKILSNSISKHKIKIPFICDNSKLISNKQFCNSVVDAIKRNLFINGYVSDITFTESYKILENIGLNILDLIYFKKNNVKNRFVTMLHNRIAVLDRKLFDLNSQMPDFYKSYLNMVVTINKINSQKSNILIQLIALLSVQSWAEISDNERQYYVDKLGVDFIDNLLSNNLFNDLLKSDHFDLIIKASYLYPVFKLLFSIFGFTNIFLFDNISYDNIKIFGTMYPNIISLMGGTEIFPKFNDIKFVNDNYDNLDTIVDYLYTFTIFSIDKINNHVQNNSLQTKICKKYDRIKYLLSL